MASEQKRKLMTRRLRIHAIVIALNEEPFIAHTIGGLYDSCCGISVITQYDRNYYGQPVLPDQTVMRVLNYSDPDGRISLVVRRYTDEAVSRNHEMLSLLTEPWRGVHPHFDTVPALSQRHAAPDYFLIVDADEIFDVDTLPAIVDYLQTRRPRFLRLHGYEYAGMWNRRVPPSVWTNQRIGFMRAGTRFVQRRVVSHLELRLRSACQRLRLPPSLGSRLLGFELCPLHVGAFHHGGLVRSRERLTQRAMNHSEKLDYGFTAEQAIALQGQPCEWIPTSRLPRNIREAAWPEGLIDREGRDHEPVEVRAEALR